ncbi:MAG: hypothetical protein M0Z85_03895 [Gammaproteobacteria bacterium]|nr:hypothetical protein [Gammaproteobacteria bacterium]
MTRKRFSFSTSDPVAELIEALLWSGLWGRTRAEVIDRLVCEALIQHAPIELLNEHAYGLTELDAPDDERPETPEVGHA